MLLIDLLGIIQKIICSVDIGYEELRRSYKGSRKFQMMYQGNRSSSAY